MTKLPDDLTGGECLHCGLPGTVGLHCSDPDCHGMVERLEGAKAKTLGDEAERYSEDDLQSDSIVSLEDLADKETAPDLDDEEEM